VFGLGQVKLSELKAKEARAWATYYRNYSDILAELSRVMRGLGDLYERYASLLEEEEHGETWV